MATRLQIFNDAYAKIKQPAIESFNDTTPRTKAALGCYDIVLGEVMTCREWSFCVKRKVISPLKDESGNFINTEFGGLYIFPLPKGFLRKIDCNRPETDAEVEGGAIVSQGGADLHLRYLGIEEDERKYPAHFVPCVSTRLAIALAEILQCGIENKNILWQEYEQLLQRAAHNDSYNKKAQRLPKSDFENAHEFGAGIGM